MHPHPPLSLSIYIPILIQAPLLFSAAIASPASVWHISIFQGPAPPPGKGPPIQASALRNKAYLPAQITSIIAAYVLCLLFVGTGILFVGRRLRREAQASPITLSIEMMKPATQPTAANAYDPSPVSPTKSNPYGPSPASTVDMRNNWPSPDRGVRSSSTWGVGGKGHQPQPSVQSSVVTFDENVIEDDRERNQRELDRLYAAVAEHDEQMSASALNSPSEKQPPVPPELQHLRIETAPPSSQHPPRTDTISPTRTLTKSPRASSRPTPLSFHSRDSSRSSLGSFSKKRGIRGLPISPPMGSPEIFPDYNSNYAESEPLSPRLYNDPGPPPTPPQQKALKSKKDRFVSARLSPRDAKFPVPSLRLPGSPRVSVPPSPAVQTIPELCQPDLQQAPKLKKPSGMLPLRTYALAEPSRHPTPLRTAPLPLRTAHPTSYNAERSDIKATVLERKVPHQSLRTPQTGVPMTPYSPYMPYTPLTPMTPSKLVTRAERKKHKKEEGKRIATIEDAVEEEADMWGDAYH